MTLSGLFCADVPLRNYSFTSPALYAALKVLKLVSICCSVHVFWLNLIYTKTDGNPELCCVQKLTCCICSQAVVTRQLHETDGFVVMW